MKYYIQKLKNLYHFLQAVLANVYYGFPSRRLKVIGATGTDGKTTTTHLIYHILTTAGKKTSMISSVYAKVGGQVFNIGFHVTTPNPFFIQKMLRQAVVNGDEYFVLETTSHALDQNRVWGVSYEIGVLTNVTHEHLDYHKDYEDYLQTKLKLLRSAKVAVVNEDDESYKKVQSSKFKVQSYNAKFKIKKQIPSLTHFNEYNYSAAYSVAKILNIEDNVIISAMKSFKLPTGRLEIVYDKEFKVIVDFAHTPNALESLLPEVRRLYLKPGGRLIHVFGSAGLRDYSKRSLMGEASGKSADLVILTEEDYRTEDPIKICSSISIGLEKQGFHKENFDISIYRNKSYMVIIDRKKAIEKALQIVKANDVIILTGKGHEKSLCRGKTEHEWNERETVLEIMSKLKC